MSNNVEEKIKQLEFILDEYDKKFLVNKIIVNPEVEKILELRYEEISRLPREICFANAFILGQFSSALQRECNRQNAKIKYLESEFSIIYAKEHKNYGNEYIKYEVKRAMLITENTYAQALNSAIIESTVKIEELSFLSTRISSLADILKENGKNRRE